MYKNGRHELLNEVEETASVVYKDILDWIQQKLPWTVLGPRAHESRLIFETAESGFKKILGWFSNRTGTSFDDGKAHEKD